MTRTERIPKLDKVLTFEECVQIVMERRGVDEEEAKQFIEDGMESGLLPFITIRDN